MINVDKNGHHSTLGPTSRMRTRQTCIENHQVHQSTCLDDKMRHVWLVMSAGDLGKNGENDRNAVMLFVADLYGRLRCREGMCKREHASEVTAEKTEACHVIWKAWWR
jgi:hypothetical protein